MKTFLHLTAFELRQRLNLLVFAFYPFAMVFIYPFNMAAPSSSGLALPLGWIFFPQAAFFACLIFHNSSIHQTFSISLEFPFILAISRRMLFFSKLAVYLILSLGGVVLFLVLCFPHPSATVSLPLDDSHSARTIRTFYVQHFHAAPSTDPSANENGEFVLPQGRVVTSLALLVLVLLTSLTVQIVFAILSPETHVAFIASLMLSALAILAWFVFPIRFFFIGNTPLISSLEYYFAAIASHPLLILSLLFSVIIATETFCCHRFVSKEIL